MKQRGRVDCDQREKPSFLETEDSGKAVRRLGMYRGRMVSEGKGTEWEGADDAVQVPGRAARSAKAGNHIW